MPQRHATPIMYDWNRYSKSPKRSSVKRLLSSIPAKRLFLGVVGHIGSAVVAAKNSKDAGRIAQISKEGKCALDDALETLDMLLSSDSQSDYDDWPAFHPLTGLPMVTAHRDIKGNIY